MLSTDLPFTEETSALAPNPSVSELSIINSDPTEKLLVLFKLREQKLRGFKNRPYEPVR